MQPGPPSAVHKPNNTLRKRLTSLVIVAILGSVSIVTISSVLREVSQYGETKKVELEASAAILAYAIGEPMRDGDKAKALEALSAVANFPDIKYVRAEDARGELFAELGGAAPLSDSHVVDSNLAFSRLAKNSSVVSVPIVEGAQTIGVLWLYGDTSALAERILTIVWDAIYAAIVAGGIGLLIAMRMQRAVTQPIHNLGEVMRSVRMTGDFGKRAKRISEDETGELVDSFNEMLDEIQERDAKLLAHQQNLKKIVRQRTKQFEDAKEIAEAANLAKTEFLATMSHEIRTPMNGMLVMAELLNNAALPPRQKRYADVIVKSGHSLLSIINDILDFSKIEAGRLALEEIPMRPVEIINDVVGLFWERATSARIDLAAYVAPDVPAAIKGDPVRLNQVLSNLVNNALKFTEAGSVIVSARMTRGAEGVATIEFSVTDTGVGIASDKQKAIFEAFSQADQTTTRKFGGTGLGLAICRKIVEAMEGRIDVASIEGKGSRFYFNLPVEVCEAPAPAPTATREMRAIIAIGGAATSNSLSRYLHEAGVSAQIVGHDSAVLSHMAYADMIFASPEFLDAFNASVDGGPDQWVPARICVSELGDHAPDRLLEAGIAEDLLIKPLSRVDVMEQIARVLNGAMRGREAVRGARPAQTDLPDFSGFNVLAADDSAVNREVVASALARFNLRPVVVPDGRAALDAVREGAFDLVLMDCSMPVMDGFEATRAIRAIEEKRPGPRLPIVGLSAHVAGSDEAWREAGMDDYVTKPFTIGALASALSRHLKGRASPVGPGSATTGEGARSEDAPRTPPRAAARAPEADDPPAFDAGVLADLNDLDPAGDGGLVLRSLALFEEHARPAVLRLAEAIRAGEAKEIKSAAHALKSMSYNVGAMSLAQACAAIEAAPGDRGAHPGLMKTLKRRLVAAFESLPQARAGYDAKAA